MAIDSEKSCGGAMLILISPALGEQLKAPRDSSWLCAVIALILVV
jgi:hypothetical protein